MNERAKQIKDALLAIGMAPGLAHSLGEYCETAEQRQMNNIAAYQQARAIKHRVEFCGPVVTIDEAIEVYGNAQVLCEFGRREGRPAGLERHTRDGLIMLYLRLLHGCGLAVTSHRAGGDGKDLPMTSGRRVSLGRWQKQLASESPLSRLPGKSMSFRLRSGDRHRLV